MNINRRIYDDLDDSVDKLRLIADRMEAHQNNYEKGTESFIKLDKALRETNTAVQMLYIALDYLKS